MRKGEFNCDCTWKEREHFRDQILALAEDGDVWKERNCYRLVLDRKRSPTSFKTFALFGAITHHHDNIKAKVQKGGTGSEINLARHHWSREMLEGKKKMGKSVGIFNTFFSNVEEKSIANDELSNKLLSKLPNLFLYPKSLALPRWVRMVLEVCI